MATLARNGVSHRLLRAWLSESSKLKTKLVQAKQLYRVWSMSCLTWSSAESDRQQARPRGQTHWLGLSGPSELKFNA
jgi:hypothetical protein